MDFLDSALMDSYGLACTAEMPERWPTSSAGLCLPARAAMARHVRRFAAPWFARWDLTSDEQDSALIVVAELTANAVLHGRGDMSIFLVRNHDGLIIQVTDHHAHADAPHSEPAPCPDEHGRGLIMVQSLADDLQINVTADGWCVRARMNFDH
ncbi:ATP-binding protein [Streptomyces sp. NBC_00885]|uniref:ATP-binding protein n=1 Tax=Streptomyces sp. NBC_00885 TaxID=2975857 RepID=UPI003864734D|nr:ATP-binding protein [Streptomyces sp. NBC_00885]